MPAADFNEITGTPASTQSVENDASVEGAKVNQWSHPETGVGGRGMTVRKTSGSNKWSVLENGLVGGWLKDELGVGLVARMPGFFGGSGYFLIKSDDPLVLRVSAASWALLRGDPKRSLTGQTLLTNFAVLGGVYLVNGYVNLALKVWTDLLGNVNITVLQTNVAKPVLSDYNKLIAHYKDTSGSRVTGGGFWGLLGVSSSAVGVTTNRHDYLIHYGENPA